MPSCYHLSPDAVHLLILSWRVCGHQAMDKCSKDNRQAALPSSRQPSQRPTHINSSMKPLPNSRTAQFTTPLSREAHSSQGSAQTNFGNPQRQQVLSSRISQMLPEIQRNGLGVQELRKMLEMVRDIESRIERARGLPHDAATSRDTQHL